jgi:hypothetical protein
MKPQGVMVWAGLGYNTKAPLIFVKQGLKVNTDLYRREILKPVKHWAIEHYGVDDDGCWNNWTFQQDNAPAHASFKDNSDSFRISTQTWIKKHFPDFISTNGQQILQT